MSEYSDRVEHYLKGLEAVSTGICPGCEECRDTYSPESTMDEYDGLWSSGEVCDEGGFSCSHCEICGSGLGGDRYLWHAVDSNNEIIHGDNCCVDCLMYLNNGDEPEE